MFPLSLPPISDVNVHTPLIIRIFVFCLCERVLCMVHRRSEDYLPQLVPLFHHVGPVNGTRVIRFDSKSLQLLGPVTSALLFKHFVNFFEIKI